MGYIFRVPRFEKRKELTQILVSCASDLHKILDSINLDNLDISEYNKRYINDIRKNAVGHFQVYNYLIETALKHTPLNLKNYTFIDYGGGSGILSLLAKRVGFGTVVYNDIYEISCADAKKLSEEVKIQIDHFVQGDIDDLVKYCKTKRINADFIIGSDVIEHIYDVHQFLKKVPLLSKGSLTMVMGTGATPFNPRMRKKLIQGHIRSEFEDRTLQYGHKQSDTLKSFYNIRREFIQGKLPKINEEELDILARQTRGLILDDIEKQLKEYETSGRISYKPNHPTNTCDPYNGNWNEQLHDVNKLISVLKEQMFEADVISSYYMYSESKIIRLVKDVLNYTISLMGKFGLFISPYYILVAKRN